MKKYNKPEIVALALETVDVIETSGQERAADALAAQGVSYVQTIPNQITSMDSKWSW